MANDFSDNKFMLTYSSYISHAITISVPIFDCLQVKCFNCPKVDCTDIYLSKLNQMLILQNKGDLKFSAF